ncbi:MAG TPA: SPASM domain-containing protein, partial [Sumerlaeia bacterium]|nr:SPASM domain-containing protein [Sumerlaeia bacterium]
DAVVNSRSLKAVSVSLDGISPDMYERTRGRPLLDKVLGNVTSFLDLRRRKGGPFPLLKINSLLLRSNLAELPDLLAWCIGQGVDEVQFFHVQPIARDNDESALHAPDQYNALRRQLRALADGSSTALFIPPPLEPEYLDPETGEYAWRHCYTKDVDMPGAPDGQGEAAYPLHPYPKDIYCICPWMVLVVDAWGNLYPCAHRNDNPVGNILSQDLEAAVNSMAMLRLRRGLLRGRHREVCPFCKSTTPYADPLKRRIAHATLGKEEIRSVDAGAADSGTPKTRA